METAVTKLYGIKETSEVLVFAFKFGSVVKEAKENDGKFSYFDLILLSKVAPSFVAAMDNVDDVIKEMKDIDGEELNQLASIVGANISILGKEKLVSQVIAGLNMIKGIHAFVETL